MVEGSQKNLAVGLGGRSPG